jgi:hypothetical protein
MKKVTKTSLASKTSNSVQRKKPNLEQVRLVGRGFSMMVKSKSSLWLQRFLKPYPSSQDPLRHRVNPKNPAYPEIVSGVESAGNRESRDSQQVGHAMCSNLNTCREAK